MKIGIISDTHLEPGIDCVDLIKILKKEFLNCDLIIHAGDVANISFIKELEKLAPVEVVSGNSDDDSILNNYHVFKILEFFGKRIGISHKLPLMSHLKQRDIDVIIHGHTHCPEIRKHDEDGHQVLIINPGSPTEPRPAITANWDEEILLYPSIAILNIDSESISAEIINVEVINPI